MVNLGSQNMLADCSKWTSIVHFSEYSSAIHLKKQIKAYKLESLHKIKVTIDGWQLQNNPRTRSFGTFPVLTEYLS